MMPYADAPDNYWTGYYTTRSDAKKQGRQTSSNFHASTKLYAEKVLETGASDEVIRKILASKRTMMDALGIF